MALLEGNDSRKAIRRAVKGKFPRASNSAIDNAIDLLVNAQIAQNQAGGGFYIKPEWCQPPE